MVKATNSDCISLQYIKLDNQLWSLWNFCGKLGRKVWDWSFI